MQVWMFRQLLEKGLRFYRGRFKIDIKAVQLPFAG